MTTQQRTKRQHIVPRWYLSRFAAGRNRVYVLDRAEQRRFTATVGNVCVINNFYDVAHPDLERDAMEIAISKFEAAAADPFRKLRRVGADRLTPEERMCVAEFLAVQFVRGTDIQDTAEHIAGEMFKALMAGLTDGDLRAQIEQSHGQPLTDDEFAERKTFIQDPHAYTVRRPGAVNQMITETSAGFARVLAYGYTWTVRTVDVPVVPTSDTPIGLISLTGEPAGLYNADAIHVPMDPSTVLVLTHRDDHEDWSNLARPTSKLTDTEVQETIGQMLYGSKRWVVMHPEHPYRNALPIPELPPPPVTGELAELTRRAREATGKSVRWASSNAEEGRGTT